MDRNIDRQHLRVVSLGEYRLARRIEGWLPCRGACCASTLATRHPPAGEVVDLAGRRTPGRRPRPPPAAH